jgi:periplasmic divalent cation tolerance protein
MTDKIVVLVTCGKREEAEHLAQCVVEQRLAACVNVISGIGSWYWWEEKVTHDEELLLVIKTSRSKFEELRKEIQRLHSYSVPEIVALPIVEGSQDYLNWMDHSLAETDEPKV